MSNKTVSYQNRFSQIMFHVQDTFDETIFPDIFSHLQIKHPALHTDYCQYAVYEGDRELACEKLLEARSKVGKDLTFVADVIQSEEESWIVLTLSAYSADSGSLDILKGQVLTGLTAGLAAMVEEDISYIQFSQWQDELALDVSSEENAYWNQYRREEESHFRFNLPSETGVPDPGYLSFSLPSETLKDIRDLFSPGGKEFFASCWFTVLARHNDDRPVTLGWINDSRIYPELKYLVGLVNKTLPLTVELIRGLNLADTIRMVKMEMDLVSDHQYGYIPEAIDCPVAFEYIRQRETAAPGVEIELLVSNQGCHAIKLLVVDNGSSVLLQIVYDRTIYPKNLAEEIGRQLMVVIERSISDWTTSWNEIALAPDAETVLPDKDGGVHLAIPGTIPGLLETICIENAGKPAVTWNDKELSYEALWVESGQIANSLLNEYGIVPGDKIAMGTQMSLSAICVLAAIYKAGAICVPIDPQEAGSDIYPYSLLHGCKLLVRDDQYLRLQGGSDDLQAPDQAFVEEGLILRYIAWLQDTYAVSSADTAALMPSSGHDSGHIDVWETLLTGGTLHIVPEYLLRKPEVLAEYLINKKITCLKFTPSFFNLMLRKAGPAIERLVSAARCLFFKGGKVRVDDLPLIWGGNGNIRVAHFYRPAKMFTPILAHELDKGRLTYYRDHWVAGQPIANGSVLVLGSRREVCPPGIKGEIFVGAKMYGTGDQGYWNIFYELELTDKVDEGDEFMEGRANDQDNSLSSTREIEEVLRDIWEDILNRNNIGAGDNFFRLGGDSIKAILISSRLQMKGYQVQVREVFLYPTIASLSRVITPAALLAVGSRFEGDFPLTPIYHHFFETITVAPHHHNQSMMLSVADTELVDIDKLAAKIVEEHDILRLTVRKGPDGGWISFIEPRSFRPDIGYSEIESGQNGWKEVNRVMREMHSKFNLLTGPLIQLHFFKRTKENLLFILLHHLVTDIVSWNILIDDFNYLLELQKRGLPLSLQPGTGSFARWAHYLADYAYNEAIQDQFEYWGQIPQKVPFPLEWPEGTNYVRNLRTFSCGLDKESTDKLIGQASLIGRTGIETIVLCALGAGLQEALGVSETLIMIESHGRHVPEVKLNIHRTVGWFTVLYPFHLRPDNTALIRNLRDICQQFQQVPTDGIGYGLLRYIGGKTKDRLAHRPNILFNYMGNRQTGPASNRPIKIVEGQTGLPEDKDEKRPYEMEVLSSIHHGEFRLHLFYSGEQFGEEKIMACVDSIKAALKEIINGDTGFAIRPPELTHGDVTREDIETFFD